MKELGQTILWTNILIILASVGLSIYTGNYHWMWLNAITVVNVFISVLFITANN